MKPDFTQGYMYHYHCADAADKMLPAASTLLCMLGLGVSLCVRVSAGGWIWTVCHGVPYARGALDLPLCVRNVLGAQDREELCGAMRCPERHPAPHGPRRL